MPSLRIHGVTARLLALRLEHGFLCDNRHFLVRVFRACSYNACGVIAHGVSPFYFL